MSIPEIEAAEAPPPPMPGAEQAVLAVLAAGTIGVSLVFTHGTDTFRLPKELVFRAEAVLLLMLGAFWITAKRRTWRFEMRPEFLLTAAILVWTSITVATSTNRLLSLDSLITIAAAAVIFIATCLAAQSASLIALDVLMIGPCINALIVILQELRIWTPFHGIADADGHYLSVALQGNSNFVGTYLAGPAVAAIVMAVTAAGWRRWIYALVGMLVLAGVAASGTRTAFGAVVIALLVFAVVHSRRAAIAVAAVLLVFAVIVMSPSTTLGRGMRRLVTAASQRDYQQLFSERLLPFLAAADMIRDRPIAGVGPGCFKYHYMPYRVALAAKYPKEWTRGYPMNWGEVHNDHLQVAAETGIPGYLLFLGAIALLAGVRAAARVVGFRLIALRALPAPQPTTDNRQRARSAAALRWPLATLIFVICLAQFPLELAAPRLMLLTLGALCVSWDRDDAAS
ncbi:MAG: hypothetical protein QOE82_2801 [Thermoanaerobaculia bacterium]|nr:hypothetical protein [Thermoanaerobaculia bacterium]